MTKQAYYEATIRGVSAGFQFGTYAFELLTKEHDKEMGDIAAILQTAPGIRDLIYCAYLNHCEVEGLKDELTKPQITLWLDYLDQPEYEKLLGKMWESRILGTGIEQAGEDESK